MGHKYKTWSVAMSVGRSVFVDVLHKIDKADKVTDNRFKFNKNFFIILSQVWTLFFFIVLSQFVTILIDVYFTPFRGKVNEACLFAFLDTRSRIWPKKGENTSLNLFPMFSSYESFFFFIFIYLF